MADERAIAAVLNEAERDALDGSLAESGCHGFLGDHPDLYAAVERILAARLALPGDDDWHTELCDANGCRCGKCPCSCGYAARAAAIAALPGDDTARALDEAADAIEADEELAFNFILGGPSFAAYWLRERAAALAADGAEAAAYCPHDGWLLSDEHRQWHKERGTDQEAAGDTYAALVARLQALADEADGGGDHPTAARIRDAIEPEETP